MLPAKHSPSPGSRLQPLLWNLLWGLSWDPQWDLGCDHSAKPLSLGRLDLVRRNLFADHRQRDPTRCLLMEIPLNAPKDWAPLSPSLDEFHRGIATDTFDLRFLRTLEASSPRMEPASPNGFPVEIMAWEVLELEIENYCMDNPCVVAPWPAMCLHLVPCNTMDVNLRHQVTKLRQALATYPMALTTTALVASLQTRRVRPRLQHVIPSA